MILVPRMLRFVAARSSLTWGRHAGSGAERDRHGDDDELGFLVVVVVSGRRLVVEGSWIVLGLDEID